MPIVFSITPKRVKAKNSRRTSPKIEVEGVIFIDSSASYYIKDFDGKIYNIDESSYSCKNHKVIYNKYLDKYKHRISIVRDKETSFPKSNYSYLPFAVGCEVKGYLTDDKVKIVSITTNIYNPLYTESMDYFRNNYKILKPLIKKRKWYNG